MPRHSATAMRSRRGGGGGGLIPTSEAKEGLGAVWCDIKMHFVGKRKREIFPVDLIGDDSTRTTQKPVYLE